MRHGETDWNRARRIQGRTDIPLNETGIAQARAIGRALKAELGSLDGIGVHVSPLTRPRQTLQQVLAAFGTPAHPVNVDARLTELDFGTAEGRTWSELNAAGVQPEIDPEGYHDWVPDGGESYATATARVKGWLDELDGPALVVSHGGVSRILRGLVLGLAKREIPVLNNPQRKFYRLKDGGIDWFRAADERG